MFTGIIQRTGTLLRISRDTLVIDAGVLGKRVKRGQSIAVDGVCLTSLTDRKSRVEVDVMPETLKRSALGDKKQGDAVNLELPMKLGDRFDGHIVAGHVDGVGAVVAIAKEGNAYCVTIKVPRALCRYIVAKGSVTVNGISLTVVAIKSDRLVVSLIPHTWKMTNMHTLKKGDRVNLEVDIVGKYIEKMLKK